MTKQKTVAQDYRDNILVDKNNPILAAKANRDRYTREQRNLRQYWGLSHIGSKNSEDALTWNVFRTLEVESKFALLEPVLGEMSDPRIVYWTLAASPVAGDLQYAVGNVIRRVDGTFPRQITEPDVVLATRSRLIVIECKLGTVKKRPSHLWEASENSDGPAVRRDEFFVTNDNPFIANSPHNLYAGDGYQLYRMAFYACHIGNTLGLRPELVSLANKTWWDISARGKHSACEIWSRFNDAVDHDKLTLRQPLFWQDIRDRLEAAQDPRLTRLVAYLTQHSCL